MDDEYKTFVLLVDGEHVDFSQSLMLMVEIGDEVAAEQYGMQPPPRIEIRDDDGKLIMRRAYPWEVCEDPEWRWKEGMSLVVNNG